MTPEIERFADLATRPLKGRPDREAEAKTELFARISHIGAPLDMIDLSVPVARLEQVQPPKPWPRRVAMLAVSLVLLIATAVMTTAVAIDAVISVKAQMRSMFGYYSSMSDLDQGDFLARWLEREASGMPLKSDSSQELEEAVRVNPEDVALFQQQLMRERSVATAGWNGLSAAQKEKADRIDPGNGFYDFVEVHGHFDRAVGGRSSRSTSITIKDEKAFAAALDALGRAASAVRFHDASGELKRRQLEAFPQQEDFFDHVLHLPFAANIPSSVPRYRFFYTRGEEQLIAEQVKRLEKDGDWGGMLLLRDQLLSLSRLLVEDSVSGGVSAQGAGEWARTNLKEIEKGLDSLGQADEAAELVTITNGLSMMDYGLRQLGWSEESPSLRVSEWEDVPDDLKYGELVPAGKTERAFIQRLLVLSGAQILLVIVLFTAIEAFRRPRRVAGMAKGLMPLLDWRDRLWIVGLGIVLPWTWFLVFVGMTPLGMRDLGFAFQDGAGMIAFLVQSCSALIFFVVMIVWTGYWRWEKRGGFLAFHGGAMLLGRISGIMAALAIPAAGVFRYLGITDDEDMAYYYLGVSGLAATGLLWLVWVTVLNLCTPQSNALRANVVMRTVLPVMLGGVATLLLCAAVLYSAERRWFARDMLLPSGTSETHMNALEERVERVARERVLELLD